MKVGELFVKIGYDGKEVDQGVDKAKKSFKMLALEVAATVFVVDRFIGRTTNAATRINNMARGAGVAQARLRMDGLAASLANAGINSEEASQQLAAFGKNLFELQRFGTGNAAGFNMLSMLGVGVDFQGKTAPQVIDDLRRSLSHLDEQTRANVLTQFGFTDAMYDYFSMTGREAAKLSQNYYLTPEQLEQLNKADKALNRLKTSIGFLGDMIVAYLAPSINQMSSAFESLAQNEALNTLNTVFKTMATSIKLVSAGAASLFDAAKITGSTLTGSELSDEVNAQIRKENKAMWASTWSSIKGMWRNNDRNIAPGGTPLPVSSGGANPNKPGYNNPGNLRGADGQFRSFGTYQEGLAALQRDIATKVTGRSRSMASRFGDNYMPSIRNLISTYAPPTENDTQNYIDFVSKSTGISADRPLTASDIDAIVKSIVRMEGNKNVSINNRFDIKGTDPQAIGRGISGEMQRQINHGLSQQNNGAF